MIKVDAKAIAASIEEFDCEKFITELQDWQKENVNLTLILDSVFDLFVDCCEVI